MIKVSRLCQELLVCLTVAILFMAVCAWPVHPEITQDDINKTILHKDALVIQRNAELEKQLADLKAGNAALTANQPLNTDLQAQIKAKDAACRALERKDLLDRWRFGIISGLVGIGVGIGLVFLGKAGIAGAEIAAKA